MYVRSFPSLRSVTVADFLPRSRISPGLNVVGNTRDGVRTQLHKIYKDFKTPVGALCIHPSSSASSLSPLCSAGGHTVLI